MSYLYDCLVRYGDAYALRFRVDPNEIQHQLQMLSDKWVRYNPRKNIPRWGMSITSFDGEMTGIPDLDSLREYNIAHGTTLNEMSFTEPTPAWPLVKPALGQFEPHLGRTHFIRMSVGGCFPTHRDQYTRELESFRLFIPIVKCNPPFSYFILDNRVLTFEHGYVYFINTCKEHTLFTTIDQAVFVVANIALNEQSVDEVLQNFFIT